MSNTENRKANEDTEDLSYLSETIMFEKLTDYEEQDEKNIEDTGPVSETQIIEKMTDAQPAKEIARKPEEEEDPDDETPGNQVLLFFRDLLICLAAVLLFVNFIFRPVQVLGSSMYPTLADKEVGISNLIGYNIGGLERFDIVIVYLEEKNEYIVKRVIGLPGETVDYIDGNLYINGEYMEEDFLDQQYVENYEATHDKPFTVLPDSGNGTAVTLGENEYYCLGDNRPNSSDSRKYGAFSKQTIKSKGLLVLFPFENFGVKSW